MFKLNSPLALKTGLEALTKVHGAKQITTSFDGDGASTNYKHITLPRLPLLAELTKKDMMVFRGYHGHEVGHILFTNKKYYNQFVDDNFRVEKGPHFGTRTSTLTTPIIATDEDCQRAVRKLNTFHRIWNFLEDPLIERKLCDKFAGLPLALNAVCEAVVAESNKARRDGLRDLPDYDPRETAMFAINLNCRMSFGVGADEVQEYLDNIPEEAMPLFNKYHKRLLKLKHTSAACKLALSIFYDFWVEEDFDAPPRNETPDEGEGDENETEQTSNQDGDGDDGASVGSDGEDEEQQSPDSGGGDTRDDDGDKERDSQEEEASTSQEEKPEEQQGVGKPNTGEQGNDNEEKLNLKPFKSVEAGDAADVVNKIADLHQEYTNEPEITDDEGWKQTLRYNPHPVYDHNNSDFQYGNLTKAMVLSRNGSTGDVKKMDENNQPIYNNVTNDHEREPYEEAHSRLENTWLKNLNQADRQAITSLARRLQAREKILTERGKKRGRLDSSRLYGVVAGDHNVFYTRSHTQAYSTAVAVYADASGSVRNVRMSNALAALNEALGMGNIPTEIATWKCGYPVHFHGHSTGSRDGCQILRIKQFNDNYKHVRGDLLMQRQLIFGGTFAVEAYWRGVQSLLERNEERKVMFFLMDGSAAGDLDGNFPEPAMRFSQQMAAHLGVETIGIGVGFEMNRYIKGSIFTNFNDLAADMLQAVSKYFDEQGSYEAA
tara:strand:- start:9686 stop:11836 length:2151 start_codon:yes stop_codon:yes gene_type:complete